MSLHDLTQRFRDLDSYPRAEQKRILEKLSFELYLRKGRVPPQLTALRLMVGHAPPNFKFNPYHDDLGRFTFAPGGPADEKPDNGGDANAPTTVGDKPVQLVQEDLIPEPLIDEIPSSGPKPSPNFQEPTNPPQLPPADIPEGWRIREMSPTDQYPNGYWRLEKPLDNGGWQGINPSTMKPGSQPETHIPFPPGYFIMS